MSDSAFLSSPDLYQHLDGLRNAESVQVQDELAFTQEFRKLITGGEVRLAPHASVRAAAHFLRRIFDSFDGPADILL